MPRVQGNLQGLKRSQTKRLNRLFTRRYASLGGYTPEQARELAQLSRELGRQVALLIDRQGRPNLVLVGDAHGIHIPELPRSRQGTSRLRGLRLLHTHLQGEPLSQDDLMDMVFLRLDAITCLGVDEAGFPTMTQHAHPLPPGPPGSRTRAYDVADPVRWDRLDLDLAALAQALEDEYARVEPGHTAEDTAERALLVSVAAQPRAAQELALDELAALAESAGLMSAGRMVQRVAAVNPKFILGKGKLAELEVEALRCSAQLVLFEQDLSPTQMRNLAAVMERRILDRTQLILDIFAQRAVSRAGKLQVELAQLKYALPRLTGAGTALSRLMGGIGGRGPGETKLETDRRRARERITRLKKELDQVRRHRAQTRDRRAKAGLPVAALVGYTNAGKSTLLNTLTHSEVLAEDKLFATLDPTSRRIRFPHEREVILTDTVGFIRRLPPDLQEAFRATLEELEAADLMILVADASHPEVEQQVTAVCQILDDMQLGELPRLLALNKWDRCPPQRRENLANLFPEGIPICAVHRATLKPLVTALLARLPFDVRVPRG